MTISLFSDHVLEGTHAERPAATAAPVGALFSCSDHGLVYQNDGANWITWSSPGAGAAAAVDISYDNTSSGMVATDVQAAIDELDAGSGGGGPSPRTINPQTGTAYTLVLADEGAFVTMTNPAASTLTVPPNSSVAFPVGAVIEGAQLGAGQVTLTPGSGVTINATPGLKVAAQYGTFGLIQTGVDVWLAFGRLAA